MAARHLRRVIPRAPSAPPVRDGARFAMGNLSNAPKSSTKPLGPRNAARHPRPSDPGKGRGTVKIAVDDLSGPEIAAFLDEHVRQMRSISPPESKHALDLDALRKPEITFWSVRDGGNLVGCGAIKGLDADHAELKSMRTAPTRKRSGIASLLLGHIIDEARRMGFTKLSLETGTAEFFLPARKLYEKFGFSSCEPFADYRPDPCSTFMTRTL